MQLHEIVDAVTAGEPPLAHTVDDIVSAGRRAERRRRAGFASAGAAALVAVAVAGAFVLAPANGQSPDGKSADGRPADGKQTATNQAGTTGATPTAQEARWGAAPPFTFTFRGYDAGKFHVQNPIVTSTAYQIASVYEDGHDSNDKASSNQPTAQGPDKTGKKATGGKPTGGNPILYAYLTVYRPGAFDPSGIKGGRPLIVAGHKAVEATLPVGLDPKNSLDPGNKQLAWEYTGNAWAVVTSISSDSVDPSFTDLTALVTGLKPSTPEPARLPFTVGSVPSGYQPVQTGTHALPGLNGIAGARDGDYGGATFARPAPATTGLTAPFDSSDGVIEGSFNIFVTPSRNSNQKAQAGKTRCYGNGFCNVWSADGTVQVQVSDEGTGAELSAAELTRIAQSIKVADVDDEATWTPAARALHP